MFQLLALYRLVKKMKVPIMQNQMTEDGFAKLTKGVILSKDEIYILRKDSGLPAGDASFFLKSPSTPMEEAFVRRTRMMALSKLKKKD